MIKRKLVLSFPENIVTKPITYKLVKEFNLEFNILRAEITPNMEGKMLIELRGDKAQIDQAIEYLTDTGVSVQEAAKDIIIDKNQCVDCGICTSLCITQALTLDHKSFKLKFNKDECILCELCLDCCPVSAIKVHI
ncbi:MAG: 4Fe-4S dicluster domain-containing protein [Actinobacteria bacterium]|nr:MAG: 4Fe-4S dicluster domain-containing protein [Actinomycetota bacterium]